MSEPFIDGWHYFQLDKPTDGGNARKLVTLVEGEMIWVGIRAWHSTGQFWMNNSEPCRETIIAWRDLDEPASGFWVRAEMFIRNGKNLVKAWPKEAK